MLSLEVVWDMLSHTMALRRYSSLFSLTTPSPNLPIIYRQDYAALAKTILGKNEIPSRQHLGTILEHSMGSLL